MVAAWSLVTMDVGPIPVQAAIVEPQRSHTVDDVRIDVVHQGLRLGCERCGDVEIVLLDATAFNARVRVFLQAHPLDCTTAAT